VNVCMILECFFEGVFCSGFVFICVFYGVGVVVRVLN